MKNLFNIRVYGILVNEANQVLLSDERKDGFEFTKFPGGGLEYGEGLRDGLVREFQEECQLAIEVVRHVHTTEEFVRSAFNGSQVIAVHYIVSAQGEPRGHFADRPFGFANDQDDAQAFRWVSLSGFRVDELTFGIDRVAWQRFIDQHKGGRANASL